MEITFGDVTLSKELLLLTLAKDYEFLSEELGKVREQLILAMNEVGVGNYVQDPETGIVYKVVKPTGTFMYYKDIDYVRTAKEGERAGSLSKKEAEEANRTGLVKKPS
jgi:hypothetical protein